ncbi:unnamed protein product, partial [Ectocarpus sp. 4 AP-2014]
MHLVVVLLIVRGDDHIVQYCLRLVKITTRTCLFKVGRVMQLRSTSRHPLDTSHGSAVPDRRGLFLLSHVHVTISGCVRSGILLLLLLPGISLAVCLLSALSLAKKCGHSFL